MRSRADAPSASAREASRGRLELFMRAGALAAVVGACLVAGGFVGAGNAKTAATLVVKSDATRSDSAVGRVLQSIRQSLQNVGDESGTPQALHLVANRLPDNETRALLSAARVAGVPVSWTDSARGGAVAVEVQPMIDPRGGYSVRVAAPDSVTVSVQDSLGLIDSVRTSGGGAGIGGRSQCACDATSRECGSTTRRTH
ncbi:MAG: hypothetical protein ACO1Q7_19355, partial [Gemmatimonas sp.]